jgi:hypothetical protein
MTEHRGPGAHQHHHCRAGARPGVARRCRAAIRLRLAGRAMQLVPVTVRDANRFVQAHHRHAGPIPGAKFALAASSGGGELVGVALVGRPVARALDDDRTLEVRRLCTTGAPNACSLLLGGGLAGGQGARLPAAGHLHAGHRVRREPAGGRLPGNRPGGGAELELPVPAPHRQASPGPAGPLGDLPVTGPLRISSLGAGVQSSTCPSPDVGGFGNGCQGVWGV